MFAKSRLWGSCPHRPCPAPPPLSRPTAPAAASGVSAEAGAPRGRARARRALMLCCLKTFKTVRETEKASNKREAAALTEPRRAWGLRFSKVRPALGARDERAVLL